MDIGIDLGTSSILVYVKSKGFTQEPSVVARIKAGKMLAVGKKPENDWAHSEYCCNTSSKTGCYCRLFDYGNYA